ncbi:hypothetical protein [Actinomadura chibensis]|uniref:Uncharacterized protein n=1 Tax=Actinomadura chibensis TaxID=392828 RepID=A0A5D0NT50_9ACTN|nr:hypothetical protein [Actinomadura chibensis]TYB47813.1 hypothetical protein FXF69_00715 [Actinomadura chibensis]
MTHTGPLPHPGPDSPPLRDQPVSPAAHESRSMTHDPFFDPFAVTDPAAQIERLHRMRDATHYLVAFWGETLYAQEREHTGRLTAPPSITALPPGQQIWALTDAEAARIADAHLYALDEAATTAAVTLGTDMLAHAHAAATADTSTAPAGAAAPSSRAWAWAVEPPVEAGLLRWAGEVGHDRKGVPLIACHWGPAPEGTWLYWWGDQRIAIPSTSAYSARHYEGLLERLGPLGFSRIATILVPHPDAVPPAALPDVPPADDLDPDLLALTATVLASWALLTTPGAAHLHTHEPDQSDTARNLPNRLQPRPATLATGPIDEQAIQHLSTHPPALVRKRTPTPQEQAAWKQADEDHSARKQAANDQAAKERTRAMLSALDALANQAQHTMKILDDGAASDAPLSGLAEALESLTATIDLLVPTVSAVNDRAAHLHRELIDQGGEEAAKHVDSGLVSLGIGRDSLEAVHHLLALGRRELVLAIGCEDKGRTSHPGPVTLATEALDTARTERLNGEGRS